MDELQAAAKAAAKAGPAARKVTTTADSADALLTSLVEFIDVAQLRVLDIFRKFDTDNSGELDRKEFISAVQTPSPLGMPETRNCSWGPINILDYRIPMENIPWARVTLMGVGFARAGADDGLRDAGPGHRRR